MKALIAALVVVFCFESHAGKIAADFPVAPDPELTPGSLCDEPDRFRYPERIAYCERDVRTDLKRQIIVTYDRELGYRISKLQRQQFKIDHYIPLCMGGSNEADNLWPQHQSVFRITDPLEHTLCQRLADGDIRQTEAIQLLKAGKADLEQVDEILEDLEWSRSQNKEFRHQN